MTGVTYPRRCYECGKASIQGKSLNHYCLLGNLGVVREEIGSDAWGALKDSCVGAIVKLVDTNYVWSAKVVHYFLTRQLYIQKPHEIWSLIGNQPIRFSLHEFAYVIGLNVEQPREDVLEVDNTEFWTLIRVSTIEGPNFDELQSTFGRCRTWTFEQRKMLGLLCVLSIGIYGLHHNSRIPLNMAKKVLNKEDFESYPWGRVGFSKLVDSIKMVTTFGNKSYTIHGCVHVLLAWIYESVHVFGEKFGNRIAGSELPLLSWGGSRPRTCFDTLLHKEIASYGKVRVKHLVVWSEDEIYPKWDKDVPDAELDNLVKDILKDRPIVNVWESPLKKNMMTPTKRKQRVDNKDDTLEKARTDLRAREKKRIIVAKDITYEQEVGGTSLLTLVERLYDKFNAMEKNIGDKVDDKINAMEKIIGDKVDNIVGRIESNIDGKLNDKVKAIEERLDRKICTLENEVRHLRGCVETRTAIEKSFSNGNCEDDGISKTLVRKTPVDETNKKTPEVVDNPQEKMAETNRKSTEFVIPQLKDESLLDITTQVQQQEMQMCSPSTGGSNNVITLEQLALELREKNNPHWTKRVPHLSKTQGSPYVGNSTVKRIIVNEKHSEAAYDPFDPVNPIRLQNLRDFLREKEEQHISTVDSGVEFYKIIITPRKEWRTRDYGWLNTDQLAAAMTMLRKRQLRDPSTFRPRIAFLDQFFVDYWVIEYSQFEINLKNFLFSETYKKLMEGKLPYDTPTHKTWLIDVDQLYCFRNINASHWVAIEVNLAKEKVFVYDSIPSCSTDKEIIEACRVFAKMVPAILKRFLPDNHKKKSYKAFGIHRYKNVPKNTSPGNCGVYSIKYIECLALGVPFDGLSDNTIQEIREKLGADLFHEVPDATIQLSDPLPRGEFDDRVPLIGSSQP